MSDSDKTSAGVRVDRPRKLGRGLASLLGEPVTVEVGGDDRNVARATSADAAGLAAGAAAPAGPATASATGMGIVQVEVEEVRPSPFQPRQQFDEATLEMLSRSIRAAGVMQPILVRRVAGRAGVELVAGERRWRAARAAGLARVPAIEVSLTDQESAEWALVENLQRAELNAVERARGLETLASRFGLTHEKIAERTGLDRSTVTNHLRLLELEPEILELVEGGGLSFGHAKVLAGSASAARLELARACARESWSVRELERRLAEHVASARGAPGSARDGAALQKAERALARRAQVELLQRELSQALGTKVRLRTNAAGTKGSIVIDFYSPAEFEGLTQRLGVRLS